ncbi:hypothetical protein JCM19037_4866 [Geomicrobium sp. JCM 19037]|uniref:hypothetical protein n=1 Tax=Geomicrobium sp. JCM 19037 TaxID=1460634 RepID=UPI00045F1BE2|nr:hypothetical protein [Geomicrobium sp. JCM 19037]GAK06281.1 hypothetical protein JCM19037_4866 [Geomicrobium sp. JCM 19037]
MPKINRTVVGMTHADLSLALVTEKLAEFHKPMEWNGGLVQLQHQGLVNFFSPTYIDSVVGIGAV